MMKTCFERFLPRDLRKFAIDRANALKDTGANPAGAASALRPPRLALLKAKKWVGKTKLRARFLDGTADQKEMVRQFAAGWSKHCNMTFEFGSASDSEIRIAFKDDGAWSYIGTDCLDIPRDQPTMNLGWVDEGVILHEFGHALGMIHEHQNPENPIVWNRDNVIADLSGSPNFWDLETIEHNMFETYTANQINGTAVDKKSIMLYAIPKRWTTDGFSSEPNEVLSATDQTFIGSVYPQQTPLVADAKAIPVSVIQTVEGNLTAGGAPEVFSFTAATQGTYTLQTESDADLVMTLLGTDSARIAEDDDSGPGNNPRIVKDLAPGKYFVRVRHFSADGAARYKISVSR